MPCARVLFMALLCLTNLLTTSAQAADITEVSTANCDIYLTGWIVPGDSDKLAKVLKVDLADGPWPKSGPPPIGRFLHFYEQENDEYFPHLCLSSDGGNFSEAIKIIRLIWENTTSYAQMIVTVVEAQHKCLSACALIFLAGRHRGGDDYARPTRYIHPTAELGFHSPYVAGPDFITDKQKANAYGAGVDAVSALLAMDSELYPRSLLKVLLKIKKDDFFKITKVGHLRLWDIGLFDYRIPQLISDAQLAALCEYPKTQYDQSSTRSADSQQEDTSFERGADGDKLNVKLAQGVTWLVGSRLEEYTSEICSIEIFRGGEDYIRAEWSHAGSATESYFAKLLGDHAQLPFSDLNLPVDSERFGDPFWHLYPSTTNLKDLYPSGQRAANLGVDNADPRPDASFGVWEHNGSEVEVKVQGNGWRILYKKPRDKLVNDYGVRPGTVLFEGVQTGREVKGSAYVFRSNNARPQPYSVGGLLANNRRIVLKPSANIACQARYCKEDLIFEFVPKQIESR
jgi:hypothetical protein